MTDVRLVSSENIEKIITYESLKRSKYLLNNYNKNSLIKVPEINEISLDLVITYLNHYINIEPTKLPEQLKSNDLKNEINSEWDFEFISNLSFDQTFHLINAAVLLELQHLHDLACIKVAAFMKDKSPEDVNQKFTIECQLTFEEAKHLGIDIQIEDEENNYLN